MKQAGASRSPGGPITASIVSFTWERPRDPDDGYEIKHGYIVARGTPMDSYEPLKIQGLFRTFASLPKSDRAFLQFANTHGLLGHKRSPRDREPLALWHSTIDDMRRAVRLMEDQQWPLLHDLISGRLGEMTPGLDWDHLPDPVPKRASNGEISTALDWGGQRPRGTFVPVTLRHALFVQLLQAVQGGQEFRKCAGPGCDKWVIYGPGTGRRNTAQYCSGTCRARASLERRAQEAKR